MGQSGQEQSTHRHSNEIQSNHHQRTICFQSVNSYAITNIRVRGIKALQYLKYQDLRLKEYLRKHNGMKVMLQVFATLKSKKTNEDVRQVIKSRRYNITNEGEIPNVLI